YPPVEILVDVEVERPLTALGGASDEEGLAFVPEALRVDEVVADDVPVARRARLDGHDADQVLCVQLPREALGGGPLRHVVASGERRRRRRSRGEAEGERQQDGGRYAHGVPTSAVPPERCA